MSLFDDLKNFRRKDKISFHIPGHKGGIGLERRWMTDIFSIDVTEFDETDDLQNPTGILKVAQERAAAAFGAYKTFFLTNGSSIGLEASIIGTLKPGDKILLDRTCHKSVISALVLSGAIPVFLSPIWDDGLKLYTGISANSIKEHINKNPDIKGVLITSPSYYGICSDILPISDIIHKAGKFLIVDEAHGAHFCFNKNLPSSALSQGADIVIQSAHKTLPALGQCSFLHLNNSPYINSKRIEEALRLLQTTSPSYILMSALDMSAIKMSETGDALLSELIFNIQKLKKEVITNTCLSFIDKSSIRAIQDETRIVTDFHRTIYTGYDAAKILKDKYGIYPEMADENYVVFIATISNAKKDIVALKNALIELGKEQSDAPCKKGMPLPVPDIKIPPRDAWMSDKKQVSYKDALGKIAAEIVSVCPPGAALLVPGQLIDEKTIEYFDYSDIQKQILIIDK
ncbi:MAG: aminotransferase class I/II-fold pyridoxal phosphate-dependent enzyme [Clostridia bacterium]|nr:aminotransferase class I/II-fold pyridoxal phosphate-dependent enzyme [Clostridia bacterium]